MVLGVVEKEPCQPFGGGKLSGAGQQGLRGAPSPERDRKMGALAGRQTEVRQAAEKVDVALRKRRFYSQTLDRALAKKVRLEYLVPPGSVEEARVPMSILKDSVLWVQKTQDYEYVFDTYRTICMPKSNFGGMQNLGNTTIVTDAALITEHTLDHLLIYAHAVIVHEFEHNQCGSETTMETPFDVWLNEAYTVDVERQFMADLFARPS